MTLEGYPLPEQLRFAYTINRPIIFEILETQLFNNIKQKRFANHLFTFTF